MTGNEVNIQFDLSRKKLCVWTVVFLVTLINCVECVCAMLMRWMKCDSVIHYSFQSSSCYKQPHLCVAWHPRSEGFCTHCGQASPLSYCENNIKEKTSRTHHIQIWRARRGDLGHIWYGQVSYNDFDQGF